MNQTPRLIEDTHIPFDKAAYQKRYMNGYNRPNPRKRKTPAERDAEYLSRRIVAIDGEGLNVLRGPRRGAHDYVMLAMTDQPSIVNPDGLPTMEILDYLWENLSHEDINVIYGGSYDFNCWIADLTRDEVSELYNSDFQGKPFMYNGYALRWMRGKSFSIKRDDKTVVINDVVSFFQRPFIQACDEYLGEYEGREILVREKARRGNFRRSELKRIGDYNNLELDLLVRLVTELRLRLHRVGLKPRRWNSPGAIAAALFDREGIKKHMNQDGIPAPVQEAARYAYAGGRFEMLKYGAVKERAYEYDINSAYPAALSHVPTLVGGTWKHWKRGNGPVPKAEFALYHVRYSNDRHPGGLTIPGPMFHRAENGTISYPLYSANWIWTPEFQVLQEYCDKIANAEYFVLEAWIYTPPSNVKPFGFIPALYKMRQALKKTGDGAHVGIKLALNSIYGKTAQQVGWRLTADGPRVPTFHQLEWAGFVTSWCRAHVLRAALQKPTAIIAFETDALFSSEPLDLPIGEGLGEWEETVFESLTYVQSGMYFGTVLKKQKDGTVKREEVIKCRGIDKGFITREMVEQKMTEPVIWDRVLEAPLTRFYGAGIALVRDFPKVWRHWLTETKNMHLFPIGKREHGSCWCEGSSFENTAVGMWHFTYCPIFGSHSHEYPVEWINPNEAMTELAEFRESENFYEWE